MIRCILLIVLIPIAMLVSPYAHAENLETLESILSNNTRLMVFSPHPDDESLGAGGLIQRILSTGGKVKVVFMTNGDGFPEGVEKEDHISHPTANDYRKYGKEREEEALKALSILGLKKDDVTFLGFPDGGLCFLLLKFLSDPQAYTSPFTLINRPPVSDMIIPHTDYNGRDLRKEIVRLIADFRPNLLALTPPEDQHPDHCATYHFVTEALRDQRKRDSTFQPKVLAFLIHFGQWPVGQGSGTGSRLNPPEGFPGKVPEKEVRWISFSLSAKEIETKRKAILQYHTQMLVMGRFLLSFARINELFIMEHPGLAKEMDKIPCCWK
jgi:LmbE family N-acetylglucosaminyl deacetylase